MASALEKSWKLKQDGKLDEYNSVQRKQRNARKIVTVRDSALEQVEKIETFTHGTKRRRVEKSHENRVANSLWR
jgi:hypothetical protein